MKKIIAFVALAILVSSCGSKMTLMKRHYTKGYYMHHSGQVKQHDQAFNDVIKTEKMPTVKTYVSEQEKDPVLVASITAAETKKSTDRPSMRSYVAKKANEVNPIAAKTKAYVLKDKANTLKESSRKGGGSDANLIVLVILSLFPFINLIAIYLHDGKSVTTNFWICLLLDILFFLPGIIFALLVVLDVVNLA